MAQPIGLFLFLFTLSSFGAELPPVVVREPIAPEAIQLPTDSVDKDLPGRLLMAPNVGFTSGANRPRFFQLRGFGDTSQFEHSQVNALGVFYEGIDLSEEASVLPLHGRESVGVHYGPQSMRWGGKALAGSLTASSCLERECTSQKWQASAGRFNTYSVAGGTAWKKNSYSAVLSAGFLISDGYIENSYLNKPTSTQDEKDLVAGFAYRLGSFNIREHHLLATQRNGYDAWSFVPSYETISDHPGRDEQTVHGHSWSWERAMGEASLTGLTSLTVTQQTESYDEDWGNNFYWNSIPGWAQPYNYFASFERDRLKVHQHLGFEWPSGWQLGAHAYLYKEEQQIESFKDGSLRKTSRPHLTSRHLAATVQKHWSSGKWRIRAGGRTEVQSVELQGLGRNQSRVAPLQIGAELQAVRELEGQRLLGLTLARGFRGAGYNTSPNLPVENLPFNPEQLHMLQVSLQKATTDREWLVRAFQQWQSAQQSRSSLQLDPMDPNSFTYFTANISGSRSRGIEGMYTRNWRQWKLSANVGWMMSAYDDYRLGKRDLSGRALAQAPEWNYSLRLEYARENWSAFAQASGRAARFDSIEHDIKSKSYHLIDAGLGRRISRHWQARLLVKNLFNQRYSVRSFYFANEPPAWQEKHYSQLGAPLTVAAQFIYQY